ncbi:MAG: methyltransferase domain-containing protein [Terracidiphilus sp.]|nr:methyltransferase domain-containing protein [Terracidiphilus sp.]
MQTSSIGQTPRPNLPVSRRFFRCVRSWILQFDLLYRLSLKWQYGRSSVESVPDASLPNGVLQSKSEWQDATRRGKALGLPLHRGDEKNWDHLAAVDAIVSTTSKSAYVLDAGAELYSNVLPALFVYGYCNLFGMNLSFTDRARRGPIQYLPGDITCTGFSDGSFDAITCMSVIEHGVPLQAYFSEMFRLLKPGGILITSTDYFPDTIDTKNQAAHGTPIKIFSRQEAEQMISLATDTGFKLTGDIGLDCSQRPVRWDKYNLEFSFLIFTLRKP